MQTKKTTRTARRAARSLALAALAVPAITSIGGATSAEARAQETPAVTVTAKAGADAANAFAEALAAWQLEALSGEASTQSLEELRVQMQRAVKEAPADAALADVLVDVEAAWVARIAAAGEASEREAALASLAAAVSLAGRDGEADPLTAARARAAERPGVAALLAARAEARSANEPMTPAQTDVALSRAIDTALASGDMGFIGGLGSLAVEPLRQLALSSNGSPRSSGALSPLQALLDVDVRAGLEVANTLVGSGDLLLKREVAAAINAASAFDDDAAWTVHLGEPDVIRDTAWLAIPLQLVAEPSVSPDSVRGMLNDMAQRAALPESLWDLALSTDVRSRGGKWNHPAMSGYFERALASDDPKMVDQAIRYFTGQRDATPIYSIFGSPMDLDELRRAWMVFGPREYAAWIPGRQHPELANSTPEIDARYIDAFRRMLAAHPDQTQFILQHATRVTANDRNQTLPASVLREAGAIARASELQHWSTPFWYLIECEGSVERDLATAMLQDLIDANFEAQSIGDVLGILTREEAESETFWAALELVEAHPDLARKIDHHRAAGAVAVLTKDISRLDRTLDLVEEIAMDPARSPRLNHKGLSDGILQAVSSAAKDRAIEIVARTATWPDFDVLRNAVDVRMQWFQGDVVQAICSDVLASSASTAESRMLAMQSMGSRDALVSDPDAVASAFVEVLARGDDPAMSLSDLDRIGVEPVPVVEALLQRRDVEGRLIAGLSLRRMREPLARRVFERFPVASLPDLPGDHDLLEDAAYALYSSGAEDRFEVLLPYVRESRQVAWRSLKAFANRPDRDSIELVRTALGVGGSSDETYEMVVSAVSGLMTDEGAALLLELARQPDLLPQRRRIAMEQFETMLQWREAAARWERSSGAVAQRDEAIVKLVEMLDSDSSTTAQRVQAVRGLGLLGAAEELPRLIGLLGDDDLGAAAQGAIDALHAKGSGEGK